MVKRTESRGTFITDGSDGQRHRVSILVSILDLAHFEDPNAECDGITSLRTASGLPVRRIEKGRYLIQQNGIELTSNDPSAP